MVTHHAQPLVVTTRAHLARALAPNPPTSSAECGRTAAQTGHEAAVRPHSADGSAGRSVDNSSDNSVDGSGKAARAVVMTMGALHAGHLELVREAGRLADQVVVTIFVNPLQFGPGEDYERYPRTLDADVALLATAGADVVFAPTREEMYPGGDPIVSVTSGRIGTVLEGKSRPGHFDGVLTVVLKLLHLTAPDVAVFGEKDAQQLLAITRTVADLNVPVVVHGVPIVRDDDGLALSSRNAYLSAADRAHALALSGALLAGREAAASGRDAAAVRAAAEGMLAATPGVVVDYLALVDPTTVEDVPQTYVGPALLLVAARVGATRLIDNMAVELLAAPRPANPGGTQ
ncbi:pantothenate synthetase [Sanguibacter gelidistatuariae]|uniref:Pantothenate synthetase n=1 Tax=Sanguibacter gelidistatuariae TaxID=1814289 RepID=A0A1G6HVR3_9MICO|nr:pantothenate synthetase [Sanguibacter gelidistatuariae]